MDENFRGQIFIKLDRLFELCSLVSCIPEQYKPYKFRWCKQEGAHWQPPKA